jgi:hypothetical protein
MSRKWERILFLVLALLLLFSLIICAIDFIFANISRKESSSECNEQPLTGEGGAGEGETGEGGAGEGETGEGGAIEISVGKCKCKFENLPCSPLFEIYGFPGTAYLRFITGEVYNDGVWRLLANSSIIQYSGEDIAQIVNKYIKLYKIKFRIIPLNNMKYFIPSTSNILRLEFPKNRTPLLYYLDQQIFFSDREFDNEYSISYMNYLFDDKILASSKPIFDEKYLMVPPNLQSILKELANKIVEGSETPYEQLKALEKFLRKNYIYDKNYTAPPYGQDPILWFLFNERRGVCVHFNSAFVLLARSLGIPARLVGGYLINPELNYQIIYECQSHAYAEVPFENLGWIIFDATGFDESRTSRDFRSISTVTEIVSIDNVGFKGSTFRVVGKVLDEHDYGVSNVKIRVYLRQNKSELNEDILVGEGIVKNGVFNITCPVPLDINVGDYFVIAHALSNDEYLGSWSDPQIRIMARTYLSVEAPEKVIAGRKFTLSGSLREMESNLPVSNKTITFTIGSKIYNVTTDNSGNFIAICSVKDADNYTLIFNFVGSDYYLSSICEKRLRVLGLEITPTTKDLLIRGEEIYISGRVHAEDLAGDDEEVIIDFGGYLIATKANENGYFNIAFFIPFNQTIGKSTVKYCLSSNGYTVFQDVKIMAMTSLSVEAPENINSNETFNVSAILLNDLQQPIQGAIIFLNYSYQDQQFSLNSTTNENGATFFNFKLSTINEENITYLLYFPGNDLYLSAQVARSLTVFPISRTFVAQFFPIITALAVTLGGSLSVFLLYKIGLIRKRTESAKTEEKMDEAEPAVPLAAKKNARIKILFPEINEPFPIVWGINEKLIIRIRIEGEDGTPIKEAALRLSIDERQDTYLEIQSSGEVEIPLIFSDKGNHKLRAYFAGDEQWNEATAEISIRIVDYREEIVNLFNSFLEFSMRNFKGIDKIMTPREFQSKILSQISKSKHVFLEDMVSIFEVANYSLHAITRKEYERMFLAKLDLEG